MELSIAEVERIELFCLEKNKRDYTIEQLWEKLIERSEREIKNLSVLSFLYKLAHGSDHELWQPEWQKVFVDLSFNEPVVALIIKYLFARGDNHIAKWNEGYEARKKEVFWDYLNQPPEYEAKCKAELERLLVANAQVERTAQRGSWN